MVSIDFPTAEHHDFDRLILVNRDHDTKDATASRKVIQVSCSTHGGPVGFTNLVLRKRDGEVKLDPHATGACVIRLDQEAAAAVRDQLTEWL